MNITIYIPDDKANIVIEKLLQIEELANIYLINYGGTLPKNDDQCQREGITGTIGISDEGLRSAKMDRISTSFQEACQEAAVSIDHLRQALIIVDEVKSEFLNKIQDDKKSITQIIEEQKSIPYIAQHIGPEIYYPRSTGKRKGKGKSKHKPPYKYHR